MVPAPPLTFRRFSCGETTPLEPTSLQWCGHITHACTACVCETVRTCQGTFILDGTEWLWGALACCMNSWAGGGGGIAHLHPKRTHISGTATIDHASSHAFFLFTGVSLTVPPSRVRCKLTLFRRRSAGRHGRRDSERLPGSVN
jgi:hypothetical protein